MKVGVIVQARMGSTRLPGKIFLEVLRRPLLSYLVERLKRLKGKPPVILATTTKGQDDMIISFAAGQEVLSFRGSEDNVLERFYFTAKANALDVIVRVTSDCPLIDPAVIDNVIETFVQSKPPCDYVSNTLERTFPRGMDVEVFSFKALEKAYLSSRDSGELEHVTPFIYRHPEIFSLKNVASPKNYAEYRWTVDTAEDFSLIEKLITALYPKKPEFTYADLVEQMELHPEWALINKNVEQKKIN